MKKKLHETSPKTWWMMPKSAACPGRPGIHLKAGLTLIKDWAYGPTVPGQIVKDKLAAAAVGHTVQ